MPKITDVRRNLRRRQIADAALRCFVRNGFEATSMADIIAEADLSAGAIYLHYENKQDLVNQVVEHVLTKRTQELERLATSDPVPEPAQVIRDFVDRLRSGSGADIRVHMWSTALREPSLGRVFEQYAAERLRLHVAYVRSWLLQQGLDATAADERAEPLAQLIIGLCQGFVVQIATAPGEAPEGYLKGLGWLSFSPR